MATAADVERSLRELIRSLDETETDGRDVPDRTLLCIVPDLSTAYRAQLRDAKLQDLQEVPSSEQADVKITARSDDLIALIEGRLNAAFAFLTGKVRIDAAPADLMRIRSLF